MKTSVYNQKGETIGEIELNPKIFEVKPNQHLLAEAVRISQSNSRQGTSNTKTRGEVRGGGRKPWKQKGTGRARVGSIRSPIWRHGGVTFGPRANRNWQLKMNKKSRKQALFMSLSDKASDKRFVVLDQLHFEKPKTKEFVNILEAFKKQVKNLGRQYLFVLPKADKNLTRSVSNLQNIITSLASNLNILDVLKADSIIALKDSLPVIEKTFLKNQSAKIKMQD